MSRVGKQPVPLPKGVEVSVSGRKVTVKGPKGSLTWEHSAVITVKVDAGKVVVTRPAGDDSRTAKALHGTTRALVRNMVEGVLSGYEKKLEIHGVGYDAEVKGKNLVLKLGFANAVERPIPDGLKVTAVAASVGGNRVVTITINGCDKQMVGEFASATRALKPPEPYKQKGIRFSDEVVKKKAGKAFTSGATA
jgi:large subunit ribosomal protein L6